MTSTATFSKRRNNQSAVTRLGAVFWLAGVVVFVLGNVITQLGWKTPYSLRNNNISDLGNIYCKNTDAADNPPVRYICSPLHSFFNVSAATAAVLIVLGVILTASSWGKGSASKTARILIAIGACGYLSAALWPADVSLNMHTLGALFIMGGGNVGLLVAAAAFRRGPLKALRTPTLIIGTVALAAAILHFSRAYLGLGMGGIERVAVFALEAWLAIVAVHILRGTRHSEESRAIAGSTAQARPPWGGKGVQELPPSTRHEGDRVGSRRRTSACG
ncbi:DUF998 domain-containing protein [Streptomyces sp. NPDC006393]|uniref:DUF998 domain-containing protein n=1 Tax=Streptomyces sp. NPDC006393 TaxID=3156763 RepID=UPI0033F8EC57